MFVSLPRHPVPSRAAIEPLPPDPYDTPIELQKALRVRRSAVVLVVASELGVEGLLLLVHWFEEVVKPRLRGEAHEIRFADDAILCFHYREDAEKVKNDYAKPLSEKAMNRYLLAKVAAWPNQVPQVRDSTSTHASLKERLAAGPSHLP